MHVSLVPCRPGNEAKLCAFELSYGEDDRIGRFTCWEVQKSKGCTIHRAYILIVYFMHFQRYTINVYAYIQELHFVAFAVS